MATETHKGRKIVAVRGRRNGYSVIVIRLNGVEIRTVPTYEATPEKAIAQIKAEIGYVGDEPDGRWGIEWYDPKTAELCPEGCHAQPVGGPCPHDTCREREANEPKRSCPQCRQDVGRYTPPWLPVAGEWIRAHRAPGSRLLCGLSDLPDKNWGRMPDREVRS